MEKNKISFRNSELRLNTLQLLDLNPRYTNFLDIDWNNVKNNGNYYGQEDIAVKLLSYEEDFTSFKTLLKSLSKGYNREADQVICIKTKNEKNIVIEGNRRILASKILTNPEFSDIVFSKFKKTFNEKELVNNTDDELEEEVEFKVKSFESLLRLIINLREKMSLKYDEEIPVQIFPYSDENFSSESINSINFAVLGRSVSAPGGKLRWPRFQTLYNTYSIYNNFLNKTQSHDEALEKTIEFLNRSSSSVTKELHSSYFIMILKDKYNGKNKNLDWLRLRTSAIELSLDSISFVEINGFRNLKNYLEVNWKIGDSDINHKSEKTTEQISNFLIDSFLNGYYSTRGWKNSSPRRPLFEFVGIEQETKTFREYIDEGGENSEFASDIINYTKKISEIYDNLNIKDSVLSYNDNTTPQIILRRYANRLLKQEINKLRSEIDNTDTRTFPYYSLISIARNFEEMLKLFFFVKSNVIYSNIILELQKRIYKFDEKISNGNDVDKNINLKKELGDFLNIIDTPSKAQDVIYNAFDKDTDRKVILKLKSEITNFYEKKGQDFIADIRLEFDSIADHVSEIQEKYNSKTFNRTVHRPYWLIKNEHISTISEIVGQSEIIIREFIDMIKKNF